jgi:hypothetical protein
MAQPSARFPDWVPVPNATWLPNNHASHDRYLIMLEVLILFDLLATPLGWWALPAMLVVMVEDTLDPYDYNSGAQMTRESLNKQMANTLDTMSTSLDESRTTTVIPSLKRLFPGKTDKFYTDLAEKATAAYKLHSVQPQNTLACYPNMTRTSHPNAGGAPQLTGSGGVHDTGCDPQYVADYNAFVSSHVAQYETEKVTNTALVTNQIRFTEALKLDDRIKTEQEMYYVLLGVAMGVMVVVFTVLMVLRMFHVHTADDASAAA